MILLDASGLLAALVASQHAHARVRSVLQAETGPFLLSPFVLAELDHLLLRWVGIEAELAFLAAVAGRAYELVPFAAGDVAEARSLIESYHDLEIGLADASIVVLAGKLGTDRVLTLDERHFRTLRTPSGRPFTILPGDA